MMRIAALHNGVPVTIRPARYDDAVLVNAMYQRTSRSSLYQRYIRSYQPTLAEIREMCSLTPDEGAVFVASLNSSTIIGYGYYVFEHELTPSTAEPALLVTDQYQGLGLGSHLLQAMYEQALIQKVDFFHATIDAMNERMMHLIRKSGRPFKSQVSYGMRELFIQL